VRSWRKVSSVLPLEPRRVVFCFLRSAEEEETEDEEDVELRKTRGGKWSNEWLERRGVRRLAALGDAGGVCADNAVVIGDPAKAFDDFRTGGSSQKRSEVSA